MSRIKPDHVNVGTKILYRPMEAAIRWCGLLRYELDILTALNTENVPDAEDFPQWPQLRLSAERIFDALINGDLAYGKNGITSDDPSLLFDPALTIRHVDLQQWMMQFYLGQMPSSAPTRRNIERETMEIAEGERFARGFCVTNSQFRKCHVPAPDDEVRAEFLSRVPISSTNNAIQG